MAGAVTPRAFRKMQRQAQSGKRPASDGHKAPEFTMSRRYNSVKPASSSSPKAHNGIAASM
ncbi:hypothetical protein LTR35_014167 [Friedmanniomyces endolithicus]|uniref:Uncharacterized protein n=1 Tax=Friedmanniomyces endolithicus TaxID=329885 RepID=A0AAN6FEQ1_9PEZI|nr:hypothetical protein LTR35_014167 [Friedmanniomyces endolithicus]KAK0278279.1 hypothetical protein LTS00_013891 [Friedmanniomyces endolithicus]KAK0316931.1 hypothetical protein LTR82_012073 [Friedmanniomyces endolithicus]KAK0982443.1 hypothetical protein LTR54_014673 [Friedmanniomyces endolithicus]